MKKNNKQILLVSGNSTLPAHLMNKAGWNFHLVQPGEPAIEEVQRQAFDLVILDKNLEPSTFRKMKAILPILIGEASIQEADTLAVDALEAVVKQAFEDHRKERLSQLTILDS